MAAREPVDPDVESPSRLPGWRSGEPAVLLVIAAGGVVGALARYAAGVRWPTVAGHFPWTTLVINTLGCILMGVLVVLVTDVFTRQRLLRPFLGTGVLGGFTTFSTYAVDSQHLASTGHIGLGLLNLLGTVLSAMAGVVVATRLSRRVVRRTQS